MHSVNHHAESLSNPSCHKICPGYGFGDGGLLMTVHEYGYEPVGVETRSQNIALMNRLGIEAHFGDVTTMDLGRKFSVVSLMDVIEHVPFPKAMLAHAHDLLEDDGVLVVATPNCELIWWRILTLKNLNPYWGEIDHCHNFSRTRLYALLAELGFEPIRYSMNERYRLGMEVMAVKGTRALGRTGGETLQPLPPLAPRPGMPTLS